MRTQLAASQFGRYWLLASILWFLIVSPASANFLVNGGFESAGATVGLPGALGSWGGDPTAVVGAENGITPVEGSAMLRFDATQLNGAGPGVGGDVWQLVDATDLAGKLVTLSGRVNRVDGDSLTDTEFLISIRAFAGSATEFNDNEPNIPSSLLAVATSITTDGDVNTWEFLNLEMLVPGGADYLGISVSAFENVSNDTVAPEFDGHYADGLVLNLAPPDVPSLRFTGWTVYVGMLLFAGSLALARNRAGGACRGRSVETVHR